jgi:phosphoglycolate phosphatase
MKPVRLFIFDLDGTLVDTLADIAASVNHTVRRMGLEPLPLDLVQRYVGDGIEMLVQRALGGKREFLAEAVAVYQDHHRKNLVVNSRLYPSVRETLEHFRAVPMAVITNKTREFSEPLLERLGIGRYFRLIIGADDGLPLKPAPDSVQRIMGEFKAPGGLTVIVGDGTTDVRAGKAAGIITCSVTYGFRSEEELRAAGPDYVIRDLAELKELFVPEPAA